MNLPLRDLFNLSDLRGSDSKFRTCSATATAAFVDYANLGASEGKLWKLRHIISTFFFLSLILSATDKHLTFLPCTKG